MIFRGKKIRIEVEGESRSELIGATIYGFPKNFRIDFDQLKNFTDRRKPTGNLSTSRRESDLAEFVSGIENDVTTGEPIRIVIRNTDVKHDEPTFLPRPSHADYPAFVKTGRIPEGGGSFSGRMAAPLCAAGGLFLQLLASEGIFIKSHIYSIHCIFDTPFDPLGEAKTMPIGEGFPVISAEAGERMKEEILKAKEDGDSLGGVVECAVSGVPTGVGGALFDGLESGISYAIFAIPGVKGIEFGSGFSGSGKYGSENNDGFYYSDDKVKTFTNNAGGILGGMATGTAPILFRAAFKPVPSILKEQKTVDLSTKTNTTIRCAGRNDPCIVPRAVPVVEAMTAIAIADEIL